VVADLMSRSLNGACDLRPLPHVAANQEERRPGLVLRQYIEQAERVGIVGSVVKRKGQLTRIRAVRERAPVELRLRRHGGVSGVGRGRGGCYRGD
jgi:hypothetical protein